MISNERYTLDRKRIVNTRISEDEYMRLRSHAVARRVSLSFLMRQGLEPLICGEAGQPESESESDESVEANVN